MATRNYLLIVLDGDKLPERLDLAIDGNAAHVCTSDVVEAVRSMRQALPEVRTPGTSVVIRAVSLDRLPYDEARTSRDYKLSRCEAPLTVDTED